MSDDDVFDVARKTVYWGIAIPVITIVIIAYAFIIIGYTGRLTAYPPELRAELVSLRFANIPECFAYQDHITQRVHTNTIDFSKFNQERIDNCFITESEFGYRDLNFRLQLASDTSKSIVTNNYFNIDHFTLRREVLVYHNDKITKDELLIYVQDGVSVPLDQSSIDKEKERRAAQEKVSDPAPPTRI